MEFRIMVTGLISFALVGRLLCDWLYPVRFSATATDTWGNQFIRLLAYMLGIGMVTLQLLGWDPFPIKLTPGADAAIRSLGIILGVLAGIGSFWPRFVRRSTWSSPMVSPNLVRGHQLCINGPYRYVRHPFYAACIIGAVAIELTLASYLVFVVVPLLIFFVVLAVHKEERHLQAQYGEAFTAYQQKSWRLMSPLY